MEYFSVAMAKPTTPQDGFRSKQILHGNCKKLPKSAAGNYNKESLNSS